MPSPKMEVRLVQQITGGYKIVVYLESNVKNRLRTLGELNPGLASSAKDLLHRVGVLSGALAEHQANNYGDNHDASECYRLGVDLFKEAALEYGQHEPALRDAVARIVRDPANYVGQTAHVSAKSG